MARLLRYAPVLYDFHDVAEVHDRYAVAHEVYEADVVAYKYVGYAAFLLEFDEQAADLLLYGDVERRGCFVADDDFRFEREGARYAEALALSAAHAVRIAFGEIFRKLDHAQQLPRLFANFALFYQAEVKQRLAEYILDLHLRVEGGRRVLKDHLYFSSVLSAFLAFCLEYVFPLKEHLARCSGVNLQNRAHQRAFAASAFAYDAERLTFVGAQIYVVAGGHVFAVLQRELFRKVLYVHHDAPFRRAYSSLIIHRRTACLLSRGPPRAAAWCIRGAENILSARAGRSRRLHHSS